MRPNLQQRCKTTVMLRRIVLKNAGKIRANLMTNNQRLTIGKLATMSEVNVETIRYYQRVSLLNEPSKPLHGFRVYPASDVNRVRFIKRAQQLGFTLKEIHELLNLGRGHCREVQTLAKQKLAKIDSHMKDLSAMRKALNTLVTQCELDENSAIHCALIDSLNK